MWLVCVFLNENIYVYIYMYVCGFCIPEKIFLFAVKLQYTTILSTHSTFTVV